MDVYSSRRIYLATYGTYESQHIIAENNTGLNIKGCPTCPPRWNIGQGRYIIKFTIGRTGKIPSSGEPKN